MSLDRLKILKEAPGANTLLGADSVSALITNGVAVVDKLVLGVVYTIYQPKDAEDLGLDADYDTTNNVRVYRHISEFYRRAGKGVKVFLMLVDQAITMTVIADDPTSIYSKKLITEGNGAIKQLSIGLNPAAGYVADYTDGLDLDVRAAIPKAQALHDWSYENYMPCQIFLEGRDYNPASAAAALDLKAIENTVAEKVSLVIGQDYDFAETLDAIGKKMADIGTFMGDIAAIKVNENPGEVGNGEADVVSSRNLTSTTKSQFLTGGLSNHTKINDQQADWITLDGKGYIFPVSIPGTPGLRWNDDHVCAAKVVDEDGYFNEFRISIGRTMDKCAIALRIALLPKVKSIQPTDPTTGKLPIGIIKYLEGIGNRAFERLATAAEISAGQTILDPDSDLVTDGKLKADFTVVHYGIIDKIEGTIRNKKTL